MPKLIRKLKKIIEEIIMTFFFIASPICFFIALFMGKVPTNAILWLLLPLLFIIVLCISHITLTIYTIAGHYSNKFLNRCCWSRFVLMTLTGASVTAWIYTCFIALTITDFFHFENYNYYIYIITFFSCWTTLKNSTPYYIAKLKSPNTPADRMIDADSNRVVILLLYFVFILVTHNVSGDTLNSLEIIMLCFMFYLAFDRLYATIVSNLTGYKDTFYHIKEEYTKTVKNSNLEYKEFEERMTENEKLNHTDFETTSNTGSSPE